MSCASLDADGSALPSGSLILSLLLLFYCHRTPLKAEVAWDQDDGSQLGLELVVLCIRDAAADFVKIDLLA